MGEPKTCVSAGIFEADGNKYAINPFATVLEDPETTIRHSEPYTSHCSHCNLTFEDLIEFEHHNVEMHSKKKSHVCRVCKTTFRRQDHLKRHIQSLHTNRNYSTCPVCGKDCERRESLLKHLKQDHNSKYSVFNCRECDFKCTSLPDLEKHENGHLLVERHVCHHCEATFKRRDHMLRHIKSQHLNQSVPCPICGQVYKRKDHVARHVREKHQMGILNGRLVNSSDMSEMQD